MPHELHRFRQQHPLVGIAQLVQQVAQAAARNIFHDDVEQGRGAAKVVDLHQAGMIQAGGGARSVEQALHGLRRAQAAQLDNLKRDGALQ